MTELPTLRAALRETAERRYGRTRRARAVTLGAAIAAACALAAAALVVNSELGQSRPADEVAATPTPAVSLAPSPGAAAAPGGRPKVPHATAVDVNDPKLRSLLDPSQEIVRAWSVPAFKGHLLLSRKDGQSCLSFPDTATDQPDIERGMSCTPSTQFGVSVTIGSDYVAVIGDGVKAPLLRLPNGTQRAPQPQDGGVIALADVPAGSSITLYDRDGTGRTQTFRVSPAPVTAPTP